MASGVIARPTLALAQERPVAFVPYAGDESASTPVEQTSVPTNATNPSVSPKPTPGESEPAPSAQQSAKPSPETVAQEVRNGAPARVVVSSDGVPTTVSQVTAHSHAAGTGFANGRLVTMSMSGQDSTVICQSPCEFTVAQGSIELTFTGDGAVPAQEHLRLASGDNYIHISPASSDLRLAQAFTGVFGVITLGFGGLLLLLFYVEDEDERDQNYLKYGVGLSAAGGGLMVGSLVLSSFTETEVKWGPGTGPGAPAPTSNKSGRVGLSLRSAF
jgi:hypothetical protein